MTKSRKITIDYRDYTAHLLETIRKVLPKVMGTDQSVIDEAVLVTYANADKQLDTKTDQELIDDLFDGAARYFVSTVVLEYLTDGLDSVADRADSGGKP